MATRIPRNLRFSVMIENPPKGTDPDAVREVIERILSGHTATVAPKRARPVAPRVILRNREIRAAATFACTLEPEPLWAGAIIWPPDVPHRGCGRVFASATMRDAHMAGYTDAKRTRAGWKNRMFPHQCLDRILPKEKRDNR